jgi:hypothetical protein
MGIKEKIKNFAIIIGVIAWIVFSVYMAYNSEDKDDSDFEIRVDSNF